MYCTTALYLGLVKFNGSTGLLWGGRGLEGEKKHMFSRSPVATVKAKVTRDGKLSRRIGGEWANRRIGE